MTTPSVHEVPNVMHEQRTCRDLEAALIVAQEANRYVEQAQHAVRAATDRTARYVIHCNVCGAIRAECGHHE